MLRLRDFKFFIVRYELFLNFRLETRFLENVILEEVSFLAWKVPTSISLTVYFDYFVYFDKTEDRLTQDTAKAAVEIAADR